MNNISLDISGKIDPEAIAALSGVKSAADPLGFPFFIIGAMARDIFLKHIYGLEERRMTKDIDFGVSLSSWEDLSTLKTTLIKEYGFSAARQPQRLRFGKLDIDLVPFGRIAGAGQTLLWPPDESRRMTTVGFDDAFRSSSQVRMSSAPELVVRVCSLAGLVVLKIISWHESRHERQKDAEDILVIMDMCQDVFGIDRLCSDEQDLIIEEAFDSKKAAIRLLGRDIASMVGPESRRSIEAILNEETNEDSKLSLAIDMARGTGAGAVDLHDIADKIGKLKQGLIETSSGG